MNKTLIFTVIICIVLLFSSDAYSQDNEIGFSPFYAFGTDNLNPGIGGKFFFNYMKKNLWF